MYIYARHVYMLSRAGARATRHSSPGPRSTDQARSSLPATASPNKASPIPVPLFLVQDDLSRLRSPARCVPANTLCAPCGFQAVVKGHCLGMKTGNETCRHEKRGVSDRTLRWIWLARRLFVVSTSRACATREESSGTEPTRSSRSWSSGG